jgi:predicted metal-dependent hydrolase
MPRADSASEAAFVDKWKKQEALMRMVQELSPTAQEQLPETLTEIGLESFESMDSRYQVREGEYISVLGVSRRVVPCAVAAPELAALELRVPLGSNIDTLRNFMESTAREICLQRLRFWAARLGKTVREMAVKRVKSYWGVCYHQTARIYLNYCLAMCPESAIDYVAVHELCHLDHPHHRKSFWRAVERVLPDYREQEKILSSYSSKSKRLL